MHAADKRQNEQKRINHRIHKGNSRRYSLWYGVFVKATWCFQNALTRFLCLWWSLNVTVHGYCLCCCCFLCLASDCFVMCYSCSKPQFKRVVYDVIIKIVHTHIYIGSMKRAAKIKKDKQRKERKWNGKELTISTCCAITVAEL